MDGEKKIEEGEKSCGCGGGHGRCCHCGAKAIAALVLLLLGGVIGYLMGTHCHGYKGMMACPYSTPMVSPGK